MRSAKVFFKDAFAGTLRETESGYEFAYDETYLRADTAEPVSLTLPLRPEPYVQRTFFRFSTGLFPKVGCSILPRKLGSSTRATEWGYCSPVAKTASAR